jgi:hypothetical protein
MVDEIARASVAGSPADPMRQLAQKRALASTIGKGTPDGQARPNVLTMARLHSRLWSRMHL